MNQKFGEPRDFETLTPEQAAKATVFVAAVQRVWPGAELVAVRKAEPAYSADNDQEET